MTIQYSALQAKLLADTKRKPTSRWSIHKGGSAPTVQELRDKKESRNEKESKEALRLAGKRLSQAINRMASEYMGIGRQARKNNKAKKARIKAFEASGDLPDPLDLFIEHEPDKRPTILERAKLTKRDTRSSFNRKRMQNHVLNNTRGLISKGIQRMGCRSRYRIIGIQALVLDQNRG